MSIIHGYIAPNSFAFSELSEAIGHFTVALCSVECSRFIEYVENHKVRSGSTELSDFMPVYTLSEWAVGRIEKRVYMGKGLYSHASLKRWAYAMIEFNSFFKSLQETHSASLQEPIKFLETQKFIKPIVGGHGWEANAQKLEQILGKDSLKIDINEFL